MVENLQANYPQITFSKAILASQVVAHWQNILGKIREKLNKINERKACYCLAKQGKSKLASEAQSTPSTATRFSPQNPQESNSHDRRTSRKGANSPSTLNYHQAAAMADLSVTHKEDDQSSFACRNTMQLHVNCQ